MHEAIGERRVGHRVVRLACALGLALGLAGCATQTAHQGHMLSQQDLMQVQPGMSSEQVKAVLGTPDTTSTVEGQTYYYISATTENYAFTQPEVVDRRVSAIYFNQLGSVDKVAYYGLKDGKVFDFISRTTPTAIREKGFLGSLFRGLGKKKYYGADDPPT